MKNLTVLVFVVFAIILSGCDKEGPMGPTGQQGQRGQDGLNADVYYSQWYSPGVWAGQTGDWYFNVANEAINEDVVEAGVILAYMSLPVDVYPTAVRPMPAFVDGANWDFLIPDYGSIEFTCDALDLPGSTNYFFRFILIPGNIPLKSGSLNGASLSDLKAMPYEEVCEKLGIPKW